MQNNIIDTIRKLLELSNSPNENEANLAIQKAQKLMIEHSLSITDIERGFVVDVEYKFSTKNIKLWEKLLLNYISQLNWCMALFFDKGCRILGRESNCKVTVLMFDYLSKFLRDRFKAIKIVKDSDKKSYCVGFCVGLETQKKTWLVKEDNALVLSGISDFIEIDKYAIEKGFSVEGKKVKVKPSKFIKQGNIDGEKINLNRQVEESTDIKHKQIEYELQPSLF